MRLIDRLRRKSPAPAPIPDSGGRALPQIPTPSAAGEIPLAPARSATVDDGGPAAGELFNPPGAAGGGLAYRRWAAANPDRLSAAHWTWATGQTINRDLQAWGAQLRRHASYENNTNAMMEGVVETWTADVTGAAGPTLMIQTADQGFREGLERVWRQWWLPDALDPAEHGPDINGQLLGPDFLDSWCHELWNDGDILNRLLSDRGSSSAVKLRLLDLNPNRMDESRGNTLLGFDVDDRGRPVRYFVERELDGGIAGLVGSAEVDVVPARDIIHEFKRKEAEQLRGVPLGASGLQATADTRDYDDSVQTAAKSASDHCLVMQSRAIGIQPVNIPALGTVKVERGQMTAIPPGWEVAQMGVQHPATQYVDYRAERHRELGRGVNMPLLMVRADASGHNFSSARLDVQNYQRAIARVQAWLSRQILNRLLMLVAIEAQLAGLIGARPADLRVVWMWPRLPHVDPVKEATAEDIKLKNGTASRRAIIQAGGDDPDVVNAEIEADEFVQPGAGASGSSGAPQPGDDDDNDDGNQGSNGTANRFGVAGVIGAS